MIPHLTDEQMKLNIRGLTADRLRTFYYVAKLESTTLAGDKLGLCQSAVSKQIQLIEDELGFLLFYRQGRKLTLTFLGIRIFELAEKVLFEIDGTLKSIKEEYAGMGGTLKVLTFPSFASVMVPRYLKNLRQDIPDLDIDVRASYEDVPLPEEDVFIGCYMGNAPEMEQLPLYEETIGLFASKTYLETFGTPKSDVDLKHHRLLALSEHFEKNYEHVNWILRIGIVHKSQRNPHYMRLPSNDAIANAMIGGAGIAALAQHHIKIMNNPDIVRVIPELELRTARVCFAFNKNVTCRARYMVLYEYLKKQIENDRDIF